MREVQMNLAVEIDEEQFHKWFHTTPTSASEEVKFLENVALKIAEYLRINPGKLIGFWRGSR